MKERCEEAKCFVVEEVLNTLDLSDENAGGRTSHVTSGID
tara:strand:- start:93 stop:212 length:120 start_codon:yes stop_codon:yes gene_type:complete